MKGTVQSDSRKNAAIIGGYSTALHNLIPKLIVAKPGSSHEKKLRKRAEELFFFCGNHLAKEVRNKCLEIGIGSNN